MTIEKRVRDYEIMIRINSDGTVGAHYSSISEVLEDGQVIAASILDPVPISDATGKGKEHLESILGSFSIDIISANSHLQSSIHDLHGKLQEAESSAEDAHANYKELSVEFEVLSEKIRLLES